MPYFVYALKPFVQPRQLAQFDAYVEASAHAKAARAALAPAGGERIRIMFAADALAAEDLLLAVRHAGPSGDE